MSNVGVNATPEAVQAIKAGDMVASAASSHEDRVPGWSRHRVLR